MLDIIFNDIILIWKITLSVHRQRCLLCFQLTRVDVWILTFGKFESELYKVKDHQWCYITHPVAKMVLRIQASPIQPDILCRIAMDAKGLHLDHFSRI